MSGVPGVYERHPAGARFARAFPGRSSTTRFQYRTPFAAAAYDVSPDGRSFVFVEQPPAAPAPTRLVLIPDWASELRAKLRAARPR